jgi:hypothetical protein
MGRLIAVTSQKKSANVIRGLTQLQRQAESKRQMIEGRGLDPDLARLRAWQTERFSKTYADLLADPEYGAAGRFFLSDIYAPRDFSQRDYDFERLHALLARVLPSSYLKPLQDALEMNRLANELDQTLVRVLVDRMGITGEILPQDYAEAYRICDNYELRRYQIQQSLRVIREVGEGARLPLAGVTLRLARKPAQAAGWVELYDFLMRGYEAFRRMKNVETFTTIVERREMTILDRIYAGENDPFH